MQDVPDSDVSPPVTLESDPSPRRRRKKKVKRSVKIQRKAAYIIALIVAWLVLLAVWYYLIGIGQRPPAETTL